MSEKPTMPITIRLATSEDYAAASAIANGVQEMHADAVPRVFAHGAAALPYDYFAFLLTGVVGAVYVAVRGDVPTEVVGYLVVETERSRATDGMTRRRVASIEQIGVAEGARGQGIGRALMDTAIGWAKTHDADELRLLVWEFNREAIAFYEHLGLHTQSRTMALSLRPETRNE